MRKFKLTILYLFVLSIFYYAPKPKKLTQIETYESKMRNIQLDQTIEASPIPYFSTSIDTIIYNRQNP